MTRVTRNSLRLQVERINATLNPGRPRHEGTVVLGYTEDGRCIKLDGKLWALRLSARETQAFLDGMEARDSLLPKQEIRCPCGAPRKVGGHQCWP